MKDRRYPSSNRRLNEGTPDFPFKDSNGATIHECRRKIPDRRKCGMTPGYSGQWSDKGESLGLLQKSVAPSFWRRIFLRK